MASKFIDYENNIHGVAESTMLKATKVGHHYNLEADVDIDNGSVAKIGEYLRPDVWEAKVPAKEDKIVLDTKYKRARDEREDLLQLLSYVFITGSRCCGLIYPPQENGASPVNPGPVGIAQNYAPEKESYWRSFAFAALPPPGVSVQEFAEFMHGEEKRLNQYIKEMRQLSRRA